MKILSLYVSSFGKLKDLSLQFGDGLNLLQQQNGFGKTTLASFVRAMFYGLNYTSTKVDSYRVNDVTRFMPWNSTQKFGGRLILEKDGEQFQIERYFGTTAKQETLSVTNLSMGKQLNITDVGEYFLGLTLDSYDRSTFFPQESVKIAPNDNFDAKLSNFVENSAYNYDVLQDKLRAYKKTFKLERGNGGIIYNLEQQTWQLERKLSECQMLERQMESKRNQLTIVNNTIAQLEEQKKTVIKNREQVQQQIYQCQPTEQEEARKKQLEELQVKMAKYPSTIETDKERCEKIYDDYLTVKESPKGFYTKRTPAYIAIAVASIFVTLLGSFKQAIQAMIVATIGIIISIILAIKYPQNQRKRRLVELKDWYLNIVSKYFDTKGLSVEQAHQSFSNYHSLYRQDIRVLKTLQSLENNNNSNAEREQLQESLQKIEQNLLTLDEQIKTVEHSKHQLEFELQQQLPSSVEAAEQLQRAKMQLDEARHTYCVATTVGELLSLAKENLSSAYIPELCRRCTELLCQITGERYQVITDRTFALSLTHNGITKPMFTFSQGIKEITLLCFRVALSQMLYQDNIPFLIIDDAFVNYDDQNFARAMALLKHISQKTQIIYFTCHNR